MRTSDDTQQGSDTNTSQITFADVEFKERALRTHTITMTLKSVVGKLKTEEASHHEDNSIHSAFHLESKRVVEGVSTKIHRAKTGTRAKQVGKHGAAHGSTKSVHALRSGEDEHKQREVNIYRKPYPRDEGEGIRSVYCITQRRCLD